MYSPNSPPYNPSEYEEPQQTQLPIPAEWTQLTQPQQLQYLTQLSLTKKLEILLIPTPQDNSDNSIRARRLINDTAQQIIDTTIRVNEIQFHAQNVNKLHELAKQIQDMAKMKQSQIRDL